MNQVEQDLGTELDWVAVDHFNTGHPHSHVLVRGKDDRGKDLIIVREYISRGLAERAAELVNLDLGPRTDRENFEGRQREVSQERFTGIDRKLMLAREDDGLVSSWHRDGVEQSLRAARLGTLSRIGLGTEEENGRYRLTGIGRSKFYELIKAGEIDAIKVSAITLVPMTSIQALLERGRSAMGEGAFGDRLRTVMHPFLANAILTAAVANTPDEVRRDLASPSADRRANAEDALGDRLTADLYAAGGQGLDGRT